MIERRALLRGLFAMPAIVAVSSLMPIRGIIMPTRRRLEIELLVEGLKRDGIWEKIEHLWMLKASTEEEARIDIVGGSTLSYGTPTAVM